MIIMRIMKQQFFSVLCLVFALPALATNVQVSNVSQINVDAGNHRIEFDLTWEDSWRLDSYEPYNYDGVWVFIKYRDCLEKAGGNPGNYKHAWLSTTAADHTIASATVDGSPVSLVVEPGLTNISGTDRALGLFIHQPAGDVIGDISALTVSVLWKTGDHSPAEDASVSNYDIQVNALEMVYIPTESFYLGDGTSRYRFSDPDNGNSPVLINAAVMNIEALNTWFYQLRTNSGSPNIANTFPNGYEAFWTMKYEISQEQYLQFLNTLSRPVQDERTQTNVDASQTSITNTFVMYNSSTIDSRNGISVETSIPSGGEPLRFKMDYNGNRVYNENDDGANIACNYISGYDVLAYLDWAALRPLTELEFEKMARGPHPQPFGYTEQKAWGTAIITEVTGITNAGMPNEQAANSGNGICVYNNNASVPGPLRCGFAATASTTDRYSCGASYYGVYELSGNVSEPCMSFAWDITHDDAFDGTSGDGLISATGNATQAGWPQGADGTLDGNNYLIYRGGSFESTNVNYYINISSRQRDDADATRNDFGGGRGGRYVSK